MIVHKNFIIVGKPGNRAFFKDYQHSRKTSANFALTFIFYGFKLVYSKGQFLSQKIR